MTTNVRTRTRSGKSNSATKSRSDTTRATRTAIAISKSASRQYAIEVYKSIYWRENNEDDAAYVIRRLAESMK